MSLSMKIFFVTLLMVNSMTSTKRYFRPVDIYIMYKLVNKTNKNKLKGSIDLV